MLKRLKGWMSKLASLFESSVDTKEIDEMLEEQKAKYRSLVGPI